MGVSESVMIGGLGLILAREKVFRRFNALHFSYTHMKLQDASLGVIPLALIERFRVRIWVAFGFLLPSM